MVVSRHAFARECIRLALGLAGAGLGWAWSPQALAARPLITDDARIVDAHACQVESWVRRAPDGRETWALPGCNPWGGAEFTVGGARFSGDPGASVAMLQAKALVRTLEQSPLAWGGVVGVSRTRPGAGAEPYAYVPVTLAVRPERLFLHLNVGARRDRAAGTVQPTWGVGLESVLGARFGLIAEAFSQERGRASYQAGARIWLVPDRVQVDATMGNRVGHAPGQGPERWMSLGLRLLSPPFLH